MKNDCKKLEKNEANTSEIRAILLTRPEPTDSFVESSDYWDKRCIEFDSNAFKKTFSLLSQLSFLHLTRVLNTTVHGLEYVLFHSMH